MCVQFVLHLHSPNKNVRTVPPLRTRAIFCKYIVRSRCALRTTVSELDAVFVDCVDFFILFFRQAHESCCAQNPQRPMRPMNKQIIIVEVTCIRLDNAIIFTTINLSIAKKECNKNTAWNWMQSIDNVQCCWGGCLGSVLFLLFHKSQGQQKTVAQLFSPQRYSNH